jgi:hypothetical protein
VVYVEMAGVLWSISHSGQTNQLNGILKDAGPPLFPCHSIFNTHAGNT